MSWMNKKKQFNLWSQSEPIQLEVGSNPLEGPKDGKSCTINLVPRTILGSEAAETHLVPCCGSVFFAAWTKYVDQKPVQCPKILAAAMRNAAGTVVKHGQEICKESQLLCKNKKELDKGVCHAHESKTKAGSKNYQPSVWSGLNCACKSK